jgi:hypothetical protein
VARRIGETLDPDTLTLAPYGFAKIVQLVLDDIVDRITGGVHVVANLLDNIVDGNAVDQILSAIYRRPEAGLCPGCSPPRAFCGATAGPACAFKSASASPFRTLDAG